MDLSLASIEELFNEIKRRTDYAVLGTCSIQKGGASIVYCQFSKKSWMSEVGLAECLKNTVLNNYNGELQKLQDLTNE